jgi:tetratricopeptide (TPR) repeat protein
MGQIVLPHLDEAIRAAPDDLRALQAKGEALRLLGRNEQALNALELILAGEPRHEMALLAAAGVLDALKRPEAALIYWRQVLALDGGSADTHLEFARHHARLQDWPRALEECKKSLQLAPTHIDARMLLVRSAMLSGNRDLARMELIILLAQDPPHKDQLRRVLEGLRG